jgi:hypothetical protein
MNQMNQPQRVGQSRLALLVESGVDVPGALADLALPALAALLAPRPAAEGADLESLAATRAALPIAAAACTAVFTHRSLLFLV